VWLLCPLRDAYQQSGCSVRRSGVNGDCFTFGVLEDSGGITRELPSLVQHLGKDTGALLIHESNPVTLVEQLLI